MWPWLGVGAFVQQLAGCLLGGAAAAAVDLPRAAGAPPGLRGRGTRQPQRAARACLGASPAASRSAPCRRSLALALLVVGISLTELALVYASIVVSLLTLPAFVAGVVVLVRR